MNLCTLTKTLCTDCKSCCALGACAGLPASTGLPDGKLEASGSETNSFDIKIDLELKFIPPPVVLKSEGACFQIRQLNFGETELKRIIVSLL